MSANPALAVDLVGVHDLAVKNDPILQAAGFRREATDENERQAWANLLPAAWRLRRQSTAAIRPTTIKATSVSPR